MEQLATIDEGLVQAAEDMWPRHSSSNLMAPLQPGHVLLPHERIAVNSAGNLWTGYVYNVFLNGVDKGWIPFNPSTFTEPLQFAYSILVEDLTVGLNELEEAANPSIYPNPGTNQLWLILPEREREVIDVEIFDIHGRTVLFESNFSTGEPLEVFQLTAGTYTVRLSLENSVYHLPYVKL